MFGLPGSFDRSITIGAGLILVAAGLQFFDAAARHQVMLSLDGRGKSVRQTGRLRTTAWADVDFVTTAIRLGQKMIQVYRRHRARNFRSAASASRSKTELAAAVRI